MSKAGVVVQIIAANSDIPGRKWRHAGRTFQPGHFVSDFDLQCRISAEHQIEHVGLFQLRVWCPPRLCEPGWLRGVIRLFWLNHEP